MKRIVYLDILKGFAIMSIVLFHIVWKVPSLKLMHPSLFCMWHVPLFFLLSGLFISEDKLNNSKLFFLSKFKNQYIKGLYYFIPVILLHNVFVSWDWYRPEFGVGIVYGDILNTKDILLLLLKNLFFMSREPIVGAMWFIDCLFISSICLIVLYYLTNRVKQGEHLFIILVLSLVLLSNILTNVFNLTFTKVNNSITAMGLVFLGMQIRKYGMANYINKYTFFASLLILYSYSLLDNIVALNLNLYHTVFQLIGITVSAYYTLAYIAKKIEMNFVGRLCAFIGEYSFAIMGLHFIGFKLCSIFLTIISGTEYATCYLTTPNIDSNYLLVAIYFVFGLFFPVLFSFLCYRIKTLFFQFFWTKNDICQ